MKKLLIIAILFMVNIAFGQRLLNWPNDTIKIKHIISKNQIVDSLTPEMFGAKVNDTIEDGTAIRAALVAAKGAPVRFRSGYYVINSPISMNNIVNPKLIGAGEERGIGTSFYCKNLSGYTLQWNGGSAPENITIRGIDFDGSNGNHTTWDSSSATWLGMIKSSIIIGHVFIENCNIQRSKSANAKAINLDSLFYVKVSNTFIHTFPYGYGIYCAPAGFSSTTFTFDKVYFTYIRQCSYIVSNTGTSFINCVFESSVVAMAFLYSIASITDCHFEQIGYDITGTGIKKGLAIRQEVGDTQTTAIFDDHGNLSFTKCNFLYHDSWTPSDTTRLRGWFEGEGFGGAYGGNGTAKFEMCRRGLGLVNSIPFFYNYNGSRAGYKYIVFDQMESYNNRGILRRIDDIRAVDFGYGQIATGSTPSNLNGIEINCGKLIFGMDKRKTYTGRPYSNLIQLDSTYVDTVIKSYDTGDVFKITKPTQYGYEKVICTRAGGDGAIWTSKTAKVRFDCVVPVTDNGYYYKCTIAGKTKSSEPIWPTVIGNTVVDSQVTWTCAGVVATWNNLGEIIPQTTPYISRDSVYSRTLKTTTGLITNQSSDSIKSRVESLKDPAGFQLFLGTDSADQRLWRVGSSGTWSAGGGKFLISRSSTSSQSKFAIDSNGLVGIGTVNPTEKLTLSGGHMVFPDSTYGTIIHDKNGKGWKIKVSVTGTLSADSAGVSSK